MTIEDYQTRQFRLVLADPQLTIAQLAHLEQHLGINKHNLTQIEVTVVAQYPRASALSFKTLPHSTLINNSRAISYPAADKSTDTEQNHNTFAQTYRRAELTDSTPRLWLSYFIHLPKELADQERLNTFIESSGWLPRCAQEVMFSDYLWEGTCLECFIGGFGTEYVEVNASPTGQYALYHFQDYRQPNDMPPPPLYLSQDKPTTASRQRAYISWQDNNDSNSAFTKYGVSPVSDFCPSTYTINPTAIQSSEFCPAYPTLLQRHLTIDLKQLPKSLLPLTDLHPCVILNLDGIAFYYAPQHAPTPDFHNRHYWHTIGRQ
ncbi:hypothetical protein [Psychrobacter pygoscelis]|uniref:hypothetical protein n=1 Tax=Psychrobacter pygoscelis TaxID=2488563 RepID=UPI00103CA8A3|nr:hypothetical protein [Psychrobacter pygoscelis]